MPPTFATWIARSAVRGSIRGTLGEDGHGRLDEGEVWSWFQVARDGPYDGNIYKEIEDEVQPVVSCKEELIISGEACH